ncbi:hypothetical protein YQE_08907, partial [Dendroctonus ponderosae]
MIEKKAFYGQMMQPFQEAKHSTVIILIFGASRIREWFEGMMGPSPLWPTCRYRGGPVNWPAQSHDLNPLDYYLWGYTSNIIYATEVDSPEELQRRICATGNQIISPNILGKGPEYFHNL